jgi:hypothetical protein
LPLNFFHEVPNQTTHELPVTHPRHAAPFAS